jgi:molybdopterin converting factor subunit 1
MQITVRLFATLRQLAGWKEKIIDLAEPTTVAELMTKLAAEYPGLNLTERTLYAAVNMEYAQQERSLQDGDEVAFFPPVSGGAYTQNGGSSHG